MSSKSAALLVISISILLCGTAFAKPVLDDLFRGFIRDAQLENDSPKDTTVVKRRIYVDNPDSRLKQVSLQSLIGNVEDSLYQTALSVGSVTQNGDSTVAEVKPGNKNVNNDNDRSVIKRQTLKNDEKVKDSQSENSATTESSGDIEAKDIYLQTTQKVAANNGVPAHVLIDRVSVQPHEGGVPIIPAFQVYHTKVVQTTFKDSNANPNVSNPNNNNENTSTSTKISIAQTAVQSTNTGSVPVITISTSNKKDQPLTVSTATVSSTTSTEGSGSISPSISTVTPAPTTTTTTATATTTTTTSVAASTTTTKAPIVQLKENEEDLKEKVAEIEAEPVILSARV